MSALVGKTIVVTGASSGVGAAAVGEFHRRGAHVIPIGRSPARTEAIAAKLGLDRYYTVDFERLRDVRRLAEDLKRDGINAIDVLANNAGGIPPDRGKITEDGFEPILQTNAIGPFTLTLLLLPALRAGQARVINTQSRSHKGAKLDSQELEILNSAGSLGPHRVYSRAKLVMGLLSRELGRRQPSLTVTEFHPGIISSDFGRYMGPIANVLKVVTAPMLKTPEQGADTLVYLAGARPIPGQQYFIRRTPRRASSLLDDAELAAAVWEFCYPRIESLLARGHLSNDQ